MSVGATLYTVWRGQVIRRVIDGTLTRYGVEEEHRPDSRLSLTALRNLLDRFDERGGVGASGVDFFDVPGIAEPATRRRVVVLEALGRTLDLLAGDAFADAFARSTRLSDYRWGLLHRITFAHPMGGPLSIPPAGGFVPVGPRLPGLARSGGFYTLDAATHDIRGERPSGFEFNDGPARRFVGTVGDRGPLQLFQSLPGGQSGRVGSPHHSDLLRLWLTGRYRPLPTPEAP
jgi:penicillin amidase